MRSRTVSLPPSCWRLTFSGPPICRASASRRRNSSMSASQLMPRPPACATIPSDKESAGRVMAEVTVRSELNAIVWKIEVAAGAIVQAGDTLLILEAMKMEIPVAAPRAGTVKTLLVTEKQQVAEGQALVVLATQLPM